MLRHRWLDLVVVSALGGVAGLVMVWGWFWAAGLLIAAAYLFGRVAERERAEREHLRALLVAFTGWAERALASAPAEMSPEQEEIRRALQADYQRATQLLERFGGWRETDG